jgi:hypothetical protein
MAGFANILVERGPEGGIVSRSEIRVAAAIGSTLVRPSAVNSPAQ